MTLYPRMSLTQILHLHTTKQMTAKEAHERVRQQGRSALEWYAQQMGYSYGWVVKMGCS